MGKKDRDFRIYENEKGRGGLARALLEIALVAAAAVAVALFLTSFVLVNAYVPSCSMENTIMTGDRLLGLRFSYALKEPERGEVVVFRYPVDEYFGVDTDYVKRIIGLPGETVEIREGAVYVDGAKLDEPYIKEKWTWEADGMKFVVPEGKYFMLGDNRNDSGDSRFWADIAAEELEEAGVEMDADELVERFTFVRRDAIVGKVYFRYWPIWKAKAIE